MTRTATQLHDIRAMPYGVARTAAAEGIVRKIEAEGPESHLAEALLDLVEAYSFNGEGSKSFAAFARLLQLWDASPELFDPQDAHNLFWEFKWVAADLADFPQITGAQALAFLDDMECRFNMAGHGETPVKMSRFLWAWHSGQPDAEAARLAWVTGTRDGLDDCLACTIGAQTSFFTESGRWSEAITLGLTQTSSCNLEPTTTHHSVALAALCSGDPEQATASYKLARATLDTVCESYSDQQGQAFEVLARGGHFDRAMRHLRNECASLLTTCPSPRSRLIFLLSVLRGLSANLDNGDIPTGMRGPHSEEWSTVPRLHAWVLQEAQLLAAQFDSRNRTDYYAAAISAALAASPSGYVLDFSDDAKPDPHATDQSNAVPTGPDIGTVESGDSLFARAEELADDGAYSQAGRLYAEAASVLEAEGWLERAGLAYAEGAQCSLRDGDDATSHNWFSKAILRLRGAQGDPEVIVAVLAAWAPVAAGMADTKAHLQATSAMLDEYVEFEEGALSERLAAQRRASWSQQRATLRDALARVIASTDPQQLPPEMPPARAVAEALAAGEEFANLGNLADAAHAFWLAGLIQREQGDSAGAIWSLESAFEGFTAARKRKERTQAASDLIALLRTTGQPDKAEEIATQLTK